MTPELAHALVVLAWIVGGVVVLGAIAGFLAFGGILVVLREMWREDRKRFGDRERRVGRR